MGDQTNGEGSLKSLICVAGLILAWVGLGVARKRRHPSNPSFSHARLGTGITVIAMLQELIGCMKAVVGRINRSIHDEKRSRRSSLAQMLHGELITTHSIVGLLLLLLFGWINITLGLLLIASPTKPWVQWIVLYGCAAVTLTIMEPGIERKILKRHSLHNYISNRCRPQFVHPAFSSSALEKHSP